MQPQDNQSQTPQISISQLPPSQPPAQAFDPALKYVIPIGRSGLAIAAGYVGLFSIILLPAPLAVVLGIMALVDIKNHPDKLGKGRAWFGIIAGTIGSILLILLFTAVLSARG